ncbi:MAG: protein kinase [Deltaproteobacteria bacterium]
MTSPGYPSLHDSTDQRQPPLQPGDELAGKYRIETVIGAGAMGVVVRAWHIELEQQVAIKFLYPEFARNADGAERFRREGRAAAKIKNQHVARVLDVGTLEGKNIPYIVMEHLEGRDLSNELRERGPLPVGVAVRYVMQACEAVAEAHERGIVHRDLKPANLFLSEGSYGERMIKVLDFGISKVNGGSQQFSLTDTATLMGSPAYMSPEQLESSRNVDGRADIWSLGVILHELIIGQVPFNGDSVPQLVRSILSGARTTLIQRDANLRALESVVARCLCQEREQRFESVSALREALRPFADDAPTPAPGFSQSSRHEAPQSPPRGASLPGAPLSADGATDTAAPLPTAGVERPEPSAWGHTQRGRTRSWQRHGIPLVVLLGLVSVGAYFASDLVSPSRPTLTPSEGRSSNSPVAAHRENGSTAAAQPVSSAALPVPAAETAHPLAPVEPAPTAPAIAPAPELAVAPVPAPRETGASPLPKDAPRIRLVATAPGAPPAPAVVVPKSNRPPVRSPEAQPVRTDEAKGAESNVSDKPKPEPSPRGGLDVPDFGGRE